MVQMNNTHQAAIILRLMSEIQIQLFLHQVAIHTEHMLEAMSS